MRPGQQRLELALLGVIALSLLLPQTAELERLTYRYLLELDGRTTVEGYSWGCVIDDVPRVKFSGLYRLLLRRHAGRSPDDYLVARFGADARRADPPPAEAWRGHPLATWVALKSADDLLRDWSIARITREPEGKPTWVLEMLREAQRREPDNALPWEAAAQLVRSSDPTQAHAWLDEAAKQPRRDTHAREAVAYLQALLEARGLPPFDARLYLRFLGPSVPDGEVAQPRAEQRQEAGDVPDYFWRSRALATDHIFVAGLFLACLILGLPWRFEGSSPWAFRLALACSGVLGAWVLFSAFQPLNHLGGLRLADPLNEPLLGATSGNLLLAAAIAAVILALQFGPWPSRLQPLSLAAILALPYLLTSWSASVCRTEYVAWVMSLPG